MTVGPRLLLENVCYHIMSRGNQRQKTFLDQQDYQEYISRLKKYKNSPWVFSLWILPDA